MGANEKVPATFHPGDGPTPRLDGEGNPAVQLGRWAFQLYANPVLVRDEEFWKGVVLRMGIDRAKAAAREQGWWASAQPGDATVTMEKAWAVDTADEETGEPGTMYVGYATAMLMRPDVDPDGDPDMWAVWVHFPVARLEELNAAALVIHQNADPPMTMAEAQAKVVEGLEELATTTREGDR